MNPYRVVTPDELKAKLTSLGYEETTVTTDTGTFWKSIHTGKHLLVPFPYEEMYPTFILQDLERMIGKVRPTMQ